MSSAGFYDNVVRLASSF